MTLRRKQQLWYVIADLISSELVWLCFLIFRWMVYDGRVQYFQDALIPAFSFWLPLVVYPFICLIIYYLSGYYLQPFQKPLWREFLRTFVSAAVISLLFFFIIVIDDEVESYNRYVVSLWVLFGLQFTLSYLPRLAITLLSRRRGILRTKTVHSMEEAQQLVAGEHTIIYTTGEPGAVVYIDGTSNTLSDTDLKASGVTYKAIYIPAAYAQYVTEVHFYSSIQNATAVSGATLISIIVKVFL